MERPPLESHQFFAPSLPTCLAHCVTPVGPPGDAFDDPELERGHSLGLELGHGLLQLVDSAAQSARLSAGARHAGLEARSGGGQTGRGRHFARRSASLASSASSSNHSCSDSARSCVAASPDALMIISSRSLRISILRAAASSARTARRREKDKFHDNDPKLP